MAEKRSSSPSFFRVRRRSSKDRSASPGNRSSIGESPGQSPTLVKRTHSATLSKSLLPAETQGQDEPDLGFFKSLGTQRLHKSASSSPVTQKRLPMKAQDLSYSLHDPKSAQVLFELLQRDNTNPNVLNEHGDAPLHSIVKSCRLDKVELLVTLLTHSAANVNMKGANTMTALHFAAQSGDVASARVLLVFGAKVNATNSKNQTPLDVATIAWVIHLRDEKVYNGTNILATVKERVPSMSSSSETAVCPDVLDPSFSEEPIPIQNGYGSRIPMSRTDSSSSWVYVDFLNGGSKNGSRSQSGYSSLEASIERSSRSSVEDSREFTNSVMPIKQSDLENGHTLPHTAADMRQDSASVTKQRRQFFDLLYSVGALSGKSKKLKFNKVSKMRSFSESGDFSESLEKSLERSVKLKDYDEGKTVLSLFEELQDHINMRMESHESLSTNPDEAMALAYQQKELSQFNKTKKLVLGGLAGVAGIGFDVRGGSRVLFLDGGGIKGLVQIEVMSQLEEATGRKITELFDWIVGTSIGGVLALAMVYAGKTLTDLRRLCFKLKDEVFSSPKAGIVFDTKALEKILQDVFGTQQCMNDTAKPKVMIATVNKKKAPLQLHFFNNCFSDDFSTQLVWKVARYTSAAPPFFSEYENYVDGGVLANNPSDCGLSAIQNYHRQNHIDLPIALIVSIGTGIYPPEELGRVDAHEFLFFGKHWFNLKDTVKKRTLNLISLISNALVESEMVAKNCGVRCAEQGIPYYRFSPELDEVVPAGETDNEKLIAMILQTKRQTSQQGMPELVKLFQVVAEASRKLHYRNSRRISRLSMFSS